MLPQSVLEEGGYHVKGKAEAERLDLLEDARALESTAGAFGVKVAGIGDAGGGEGADAGDCDSRR